jgi:hypothetical protein
MRGSGFSCPEGGLLRQTDWNMISRSVDYVMVMSVGDVTVAIGR